MAVINFAIPKTLERRVAQAVKTKGFVSKAEFFRMAAMYFLDSGNTLKEEDRTKLLVSAIKKEVTAQYKGKKVPSLAKQLHVL